MATTTYDGRSETLRALRWLSSPPLRLTGSRRTIVFGGGLFMLVAVCYVAFKYLFLALIVGGIMAVRLFAVLVALSAWGAVSLTGVIRRKRGRDDGDTRTSTEAQRPTTTGERPGLSR